MTSSINVHAVRFGGDQHFHYVINGALVRIAVTHDSLCRVFGSDGSATGDHDALQCNIIEILHVAVAKAYTSKHRPVVLSTSDFGSRP
jgi:hypothetical protein